MKPASPDRRKLVLGGAALLAGAIPPGSAVAENAASLTKESTMPPTPDYAVFTEFSPDNKQMKPGWTMVAYNSGGEPPEMTTIRAPASAGYCRLRTVDPDVGVESTDLHALDNGDPTVICIGSPSSANLVPSLFESFYETDKTARIVLEHQSGTKPEQIYLRVFVQNSKWHAFARISIRGL